MPVQLRLGNTEVNVGTALDEINSSNGPVNIWPNPSVTVRSNAEVPIVVACR